MKSWHVLQLAVFGLIVVATSVVVGTVILVSLSQTVPDGIIALGSAAVGALATLMTTRGFSEPPDDS